MNTALRSNIRFYFALALGAALAFASIGYAAQVKAQTVDGNLTATVTATPNSGGTSTNTTATTTTDTAALHTRIIELESDVDSLRTELFSLRMDFGILISMLHDMMASSTAMTGTTTVSNSGTDMGQASSTAIGQWIRIYPENATARAGTSIDWNGRGFWADEMVTVWHNGMAVGTARADSQGSFSTGSMPVSATTGMHSYAFMGGWSGMTGTANLNVTQ